MEPWRALAQAVNEFYGHPVNPLSYLPGSRNVAAAFDLVGRLTQRYERPDFGIGKIRVGARDIAVREVFELDRPFCRLLHFTKPGAPKQPKVLLFAPLSGHFATLLRDTVRTLLPDHDVWITDWIDAKEVPLSAGPFHFDDYVDYVRDFLRFLHRGRPILKQPPLDLGVIHALHNDVPTAVVIVRQGVSLDSLHQFRDPHDPFLPSGCPYRNHYPTRVRHDPAPVLAPPTLRRWSRVTRTSDTAQVAVPRRREP
jgi:hypothetical protein